MSSTPQPAKQAELEKFRLHYPEKLLRAGADEWRYRVIVLGEGSAERALVLLPGGELVNDLGFEFASALASTYRVIYPAYPRVSSIDELADGLCTILDAETIKQCAMLGASFGGDVAQIFVRRHPLRIDRLILSNTDVPLRHLARAIRFTEWVVRALPWRMTATLLRKPLMKTVDPSAADPAFWTTYFEELFDSRLTKADVVANVQMQREFHRRFHFAPNDLEHWHGRILIAESDTDVIGPGRRKALREAYPSAAVHTFHHAGHAPVFSHPAEYFAMIEKFLAPGENSKS